MIKKLLTLFLCSLSVAATAQKFTIRGQATDTLKSPMPSATVMLLQAKDSALVSFGTTDKTGQFELKNVSKGDYQLKVTFIGYAPRVKNITSSSFTTPILEVGSLRMEPVSKELEALIVKGEKAPVTVKQDTIEFNAGSFKVKTNANVEDLIKKMPGMEVETDGSIRAQGEQVQRVTVDGREFFGRDPKLATRNLPADAVDKVQVFDRKSDQAQFTGIEDGQREKTINLELKEEKRNGAFGNMMGGAGTEDRFQARASINRFSKGEQISFLGMGNNVNEQGFSMDDYMNFTGGSQQMMGGGGGQMTIQMGGNSNSSGVPLNFGGRQNGIITNYAGGLNTNQDFGKNTKLNASYFYNNLNQDINQAINRINYLPNGSYDFNQVSRTNNKSDNHRGNLVLDHMLDSANSFKFNASATLTHTEQSVQSQSQTMNINDQLQNESVRDSYTKGQSASLNSNLLYRHRFGKKGRTISTNLTLGIGQTNSDGNLLSTNEFFTTVPEKKVIEQTNNQKNESQSYGASVSYTEPLGGRKYLEANYTIRTNINDVVRDVYNVNGGTPVYNDTLSNRYKSNYLYNRPGMNIRVNRQKFNVTVGASYQHTSLKGDLTLRDTTINRTFENILPVVRFNYDFTSFKHFRLDYETSMQEPTIQQLQPVIDNSDPLNLSSGNPNLRPGYGHMLRMNYTQFDPASGIGFFAFVTTMYTKNAITYSQTVDPQTLVRLTVPVNVDNNLRTSGNFNFQFPIRKISSRISIGPSATYTRGITLINLEENRSDTRTYGGNFRYDYNFKEVLTWGVSANLSQNRTEYSFNTKQNQQYLNETYATDLNINLLKNYSLDASYTFYHYRSQTTGFDTTIPIVNLSVSRFLLKNNVGELKFAVVNALDKSLGASQTAGSNYLQTETMNNLGRYYMLSFTYVLNKQLNPMGGGRGGRRGMRMMMNEH